jgi:hypothetical protein
MRKVTILLILQCAACIGGPCTNTSTTGTCTVTQVGDSHTMTQFSFTPASATVPLETWQLTLPTGDSPSASCLSANHIQVGTNLSCTRTVENPSGGCAPPPRYSLPAFDPTIAGCP